MPIRFGDKMTAKKNQHYRMILVTLSDTFPYSSAEIAKWTPLNRFQTARRLPEIERVGWVKRTVPKPCSVTKRRCVGWVLTGKGKDYVDNELLFV